MNFDMETVLIFTITILGVLSALVIALRIITTDMRRQHRNAVERLFDNVRFGSDEESMLQFKLALSTIALGDEIDTRVFQKAVRTFSTIASKTNDPLDKAYCLRWAGQCYEDIGDMHLALISYGAAAAVAPSDIKACEWLGDFFTINKLNLGDESSDFLSKIGILKNPLEYYEQVLKYDPNSAIIYHKLGKLHSKDGDAKLAISRYEEAIKANGCVSSIAEAAIEYAKLGDKKNVLKYFNLAMACDVREYKRLEEEVVSCLT